MPQAPGSRKWLISVVIAVSLALAAAWLLRSRHQAKPALATANRTVLAVRGVLQNSLRLTGSVTTKYFASIAAPMIQTPDAGRALVLIYLPDSGSLVKKGQLLAEIDAQALKDHLDDAEAQLAQAALDLRKRQSQHTAQAEVARQRARAAKASLEKAKLDLRTLEVRTGLDRQLLKLAAEEAQATYDEAQQEIAMVAQRQEAELHILDIARESRERHRDHHLADLRRFTITSPIDGQVVMRSVMRGGDQGQVRVGDELSPGQPFMRVVDLGNMQLESTMNQTESQMVRIGQHAQIHFDAYPELVLIGHVEAVGALATSGRRANHFIHRVPVRIVIDCTDPRVIPDLTASADVVIAEQDDALIVPREAVHEEGGKPVVYVKQADTFAPREVELGLASATQVAVLSGLQAGEEIALQSFTAAVR